MSTQQEKLDAFIKRAGFSYGWANLESWARRMAEKAVEEQESLPQALNALRANDQWHWDHDDPNDHSGYAESELHEQNTAAIAALEQAVKP